MSFSAEWEECFSAGTHQSVWPWSDLVSHVKRNSKILDGQRSRVLEIGMGIGANIPFFESLGVTYFGMDGSKTAVETAKKRFSHLAQNMRDGDFTLELPFAPPFDMVVDRAALTHNDEKSIRRCLELIYESLKPGGLYIGIDWFGTKHTDFKLGRVAGDSFTKTGITSGQFANLGVVHFSDDRHLRDLFSRFKIIRLELKEYTQCIPESQHHFASWNIVASK